MDGARHAIRPAGLAGHAVLVLYASPRPPSLASGLVIISLHAALIAPANIHAIANLHVAATPPAKKHATTRRPAAAIAPVKIRAAANPPVLIPAKTHAMTKRHAVAPLHVVQYLPAAGRHVAKDPPASALRAWRHAINQPVLPLVITNLHAVIIDPAQPPATQPAETIPLARDIAPAWLRPA